MIKLDMDVDFLQMNIDTKRFNQQVIEVGILNERRRANEPDRKRGLKNFEGKKASYVSEEKPKNPMKLTELAKMLDERFGVFSRAERNFQNQDVIEVANALAEVFIRGGKVDAELQRRIENAAIALVTNPVYRGDYGDNSTLTAAQKGFNWLMVDTGTFIRAIRARYTHV